MPKGVPTPIDDLLIKQTAALILGGDRELTVISEKLKIDRKTLRRVMAHPNLKAIVADAGDAALSNAKAFIRVETGKMAQKIIKAINQALDEGNLDAVKVGLKILGFNDQEPVAHQPQALTVVFPGATPPEPKNVDNIVEIPE